MHVGLLTHLGNSLVIIVAVVALHNFTIMQRESHMNDVDWGDDDNESEEPSGAADASGNAKRKLIIARYFT